MDFTPKFINESAGPPLRAIGTTMAEIWNLTIGSHISLWSKKQVARQQVNLKNYIDNIEEQTQAIPVENLTDPQLHIVGPALEASKYYIDSDELRNMFANLVAASIDDRRTDIIHPSFVEIIKQMSPLDAKLLSNFKNTNQFSLVELRATQKSGEYIVLEEHVMNFSNNKPYKSHIASLSNLQRLGLLMISYSSIGADPSEYEFVKTHPAYADAYEKMLEYNEFENVEREIEIKKGICYKTPLCANFINICL